MCRFDHSVGGFPAFADREALAIINLEFRRLIQGSDKPQDRESRKYRSPEYANCHLVMTSASGGKHSNTVYD